MRRGTRRSTTRWRAHTCTWGDNDEARSHGETALLIKDHESSLLEPIHSLHEVSIPPFDPRDRDRNVIAFSLWGQSDRYLNGALRNAELVHEIYPAWHCRFYCDSTVPADTTSRLLSLGATVVLLPTQAQLFQGLFWRFHACFDASIDRYLIRDADSVLNLRERAAVDEWLASDKHFHAMGDFATHSDPILAGLWGGVRGALPDLRPWFDEYLNDIAKTANCDQKFLREVVWPVARQSCLRHDSVFRVLGFVPFPENARLGPGRHVGQDMRYQPAPSPGRVEIARPDLSTDIERRRRFVFTIAPGRCGTRFLSSLLERNLPAAEVHHERIGYRSFGVHTPDASHFTLFNSVGNVSAVREFWSRKLTALRYGNQPHYVETSHFLAKAGLVENLDLLGDEPEVHLIVLRRELFALAWSLANRMDFANFGFTWLFALDPRYPRIIVDPSPLDRFGMLGHCVVVRTRDARAGRVLPPHRRGSRQRESARSVAGRPRRAGRRRCDGAGNRSRGEGDRHAGEGEYPPAGSAGRVGAARAEEDCRHVVLRSGRCGAILHQERPPTRVTG